MKAKAFEIQRRHPRVNRYTRKQLKGFEMFQDTPGDNYIMFTKEGHPSNAQCISFTAMRDKLVIGIVSKDDQLLIPGIRLFVNES